ncbi:hypothetical protein [Clostridium sp. J1101437_171009_A5]|uniref:hypothetical protein n=1 Tax=Clostridium sp. J1101437_171009_A5 TaxID=2787098 RepID=UPI0018975DD0|nr:hypothetical protein [Clostridium sp. J1101437_171009_A5]
MISLARAVELLHHLNGEGSSSGTWEVSASSGSGARSLIIQFSEVGHAMRKETGGNPTNCNDLFNFYIHIKIPFKIIIKFRDMVYKTPLPSLFLLQKQERGVRH